MGSLEAFFVIALCLYTAVIWWNVWQRGLTPIMLCLFGLALVADLTGTILCVIEADGWHWSFHGTAGLIALIIMGLHFIWGFWSTWGRSQSATRNFHRFSLYAWALWCMAFGSGLPW